MNKLDEFYIGRFSRDDIHMENLEKYAIFDEILETFKMNKIKVNNSLF
jgi:hypothetical protein